MKLFDDIVFGPIKSRRLGSSLGINLLSPTAKVCNFDCIYCECGWTNPEDVNNKFVNHKELIFKLKNGLVSLIENDQKIDCITFAGNGEPTLHPHFSTIVDNVVTLRNRWMPDVKIAVLSNATTLRKKSIIKALQKVDKRILKLDTGSENSFQLINGPLGKQTLDQSCRRMKGLFGGNFSIQSMFLSGQIRGVPFDNTEGDEIEAWLKRVVKINPKEVLLYSIDRKTPLESLKKIPKEKLDIIANRLKSLGLSAHVSV